MDILKVNGVALPTPDAGMKFGEYDLQSVAYRDELGHTHKTTVRWGVRKLFPTWKILTKSQLTLIRNLCKGQEYVTVTYYSDQSGSGGTFTAYTGDMEYSLKRALSENKAIYENFSMNIIEE